jgi:hypothetical protein
MNDTEKVAIEETRARAKQLLFDAKGKRRPEEYFVSAQTFQTILRPATIEEAMNPQDGLTLFDWKGTSLAYDAGWGDLLVALAREGDAGCDRMICKAAAVMLDGAGCIEDRLLRTYIRDRLLGGITPQAKPKRGRSSKDTWGRDAVIVGRLIPPLLNRFHATRNKASRNKEGAAESACSIVSKALARMGKSGYDGINITEERIEDIWDRWSHTVPAK